MSTRENICSSVFNSAMSIILKNLSSTSTIWVTMYATIDRMMLKKMIDRNLELPIHVKVSASYFSSIGRRAPTQYGF